MIFSEAWRFGLAIVANTMGFVNHLKSVKFRKTHMKRKEIRPLKDQKKSGFIFKKRFILYMSSGIRC